MSSLPRRAITKARKDRIERDGDKNSLPGWIAANWSVRDLIVALPRCDDQVTNKDVDALASVSCLLPYLVATGSGTNV